jgi:FMN reductase (NADPH)
MTNQTLELIKSHASVRKFKPIPVSDEMVETIVSAAQQASTSSNLQAYSVIVTTKTENLEKLARISSNQEHVRTAPVFLTWCADLARLQKVCLMRNHEQNTNFLENFLVAAIDAVIAAQNAALAAESLGLGICYIGGIRNNPGEVIKLFELPKLVFPITGMTIGWPYDKSMVRPRLPLTAILHREKYDSTMYEKALLDYDRAMIDTGIYNNRQVPHPDRNGEMENYGWLEHSARRVSQIIRPNLREEIQKQGFGLN